MAVFWAFYLGTKLEIILHQNTISTWDWISLGINIFMVWFFANQVNRNLKSVEEND
jgi:hypothetical protein